MTLRRCTAIAACVLTLLLTGFAQRHRDPLTDKEADQIREAAQEPVARMKLLVKFTRARMEMIDHLRSDQNMATKQVDEIAQLLSDVANLVDEIDDNLSAYDGKGDDLRKALREVVQADTDWQLKLRTIRETSNPEQLKSIGFALENAVESVNASADSSRAMLQDQNARKGKEPVEKPEKPGKPEKQQDAKKDTGRDEQGRSTKQRPDYTGMGGVGSTPPKRMLP